MLYEKRVFNFSGKIVFWDSPGEKYDSLFYEFENPRCKVSHLNSDFL
jgi:hypothetical protein